jgi:hypothetical protein
LNNAGSPSSAGASGNTAQDALLALLQGSNNGSSSSSNSSSTTATANNSALAWAISLYQAQLNQQIGGIFETSSTGV